MLSLHTTYPCIQKAGTQMSKNTHTKLDDKLTQTMFLNRETSETHERYEEELERFSAIHQGDGQKAQAIVETFRNNTYSHLSADPVRNKRYLFVVNATLATRFSIEGGVPMETAYNISDLYIQRMDRCRTVEEIISLLDDMLHTFIEQVNLSKNTAKEKQPSPAVLQAIEYINNHLHESLTLLQISEEVHLTPAYFSALFQRDTGKTLTAYIMQEKIHASCNLLRFSQYSGVEIASYLSFSSHSHFCKQFKSLMGITPKQYRNNYFRNKWRE